MAWGKLAQRVDWRRKGSFEEATWGFLGSVIGRNYDVAEIEVRLAQRDAYDDVCNAP